jgi:hypothetical protein
MPLTFHLDLALNLSAGRKSGGDADPKERIPHEQANRTKLPGHYTRPGFHLCRELDSQRPLMEKWFLAAT